MTNPINDAMLASITPFLGFFNGPMGAALQLRTDQLIQESFMGELIVGCPQRPFPEELGDGGQRNTWSKSESSAWRLNAIVEHQ